MKLKNLAIGYSSSKGATIIQSGINESLIPGKFTCLLGPNGAGKSTLMKTLATFIPPLGGTIEIDGINISSFTKAELSTKISVVLTEKPTVQSMTVYELTGLGRSPYSGFWGKLGDEDDDIVIKSLTMTNSLHLKDRLVDSLSDGERQRVMIAKALAQNTQTILLDEPTAFLDFPSKVESMKLMAQIAHNQNKCILLSTHDLNMALDLADILWVVDKKFGFVSGSPRELARNGVLANFFVRKGITFDAETLNFSIEK